MYEEAEFLPLVEMQDETGHSRCSLLQMSSHWRQATHTAHYSTTTHISKPRNTYYIIPNKIKFVTRQKSKNQKSIGTQCIKIKLKIPLADKTIMKVIKLQVVIQSEYQIKFRLWQLGFGNFTSNQVHHKYCKLQEHKKSLNKKWYYKQLL